MPFMKVSVIAFSLVGVAGLMAPSALSAWELTSNPDCTNMSVLLTQEQCSGAYSLDPGENDITDGDADNIVTTILNDNDLFGAEDWTFLGKDEGNGTDYFTVTGIGSTSGTISLNGTATFEDFGLPSQNGWDIAISFKAAGNFSLYQWSLDPSVTELSWTTEGTSTNHRGNPRDLSHASIFIRGDVDTPVAVPEPATAALVGAFLIVVSLITRRSSKNHLLSG